MSKPSELFAPLSIPAYRRLWSAEVASGMGDWAARLALSVLVLDRSGSATVMALVTAASLVPWLGPGQILATFGDRFGRRAVMIASDVVRAIAFLTLLLPGLPVGAMLALALVAGLATPPFAAARSASVPSLVPASKLGPAMALGQMTQDASIIAGYLAGGLILAVVGAPVALALNAATFLLSAVLVAGLPKVPRRVGAGVRKDLALGARLLVDDRAIRRCVVLVLVASFSFAAIEAIAVVFADRVGGGGQGWAAGVALAGSAVVSLVVTPFVPTDGAARLVRWTAGLTAAGAAVAIAGFVVLGDDVLGVIAFAIAGVLMVVIVPANVLVAPRLPDDLRASALSLLMGTLVASQALGATLGGFLADRTSPSAAAVLLTVPAALAGAAALVLPIAIVDERVDVDALAA